MARAVEVEVMATRFRHGGAAAKEATIGMKPITYYTPIMPAPENIRPLLHHTVSLFIILH
jgi:hypothetical protein